MSIGPQSVHIVSTDFDYATGEPDYDRIGYALKQQSPEKVYLLYNKEPKDESRELEEGAKKRIEQKLKNETLAESKGGIHTVGVDYYNFQEALVTVYEIIYQEKSEKNNLYINLSGGTKPLAIAMAFASSLAGLEQSPFYVAKEYKKEGDHVKSSGLLESMDISMLDVFNLENNIPSDEKEKNLLLYLLNSKESEIGITDLLIENDVIQRKQESPDIQERTRIIQSYHRKSDVLVSDNMIEKTNSKYQFTSTGKLVARILNVRNGIESSCE